MYYLQLDALNATANTQILERDSISQTSKDRLYALIYFGKTHLKSHEVKNIMGNRMANY